MTCVLFFCPSPPQTNLHFLPPMSLAYHCAAPLPMAYTVTTHACTGDPLHPAPPPDVVPPMCPFGCGGSWGALDVRRPL